MPHEYYFTLYKKQSDHIWSMLSNKAKMAV